jgi:hypothetical protein
VSVWVLALSAVGCWHQYTHSEEAKEEKNKLLLVRNRSFSVHTQTKFMCVWILLWNFTVQVLTLVEEICVSTNKLSGREEVFSSVFCLNKSVECFVYIPPRSRRRRQCLNRSRSERKIPPSFAKFVCPGKTWRTPRVPTTETGWASNPRPRVAGSTASSIRPRPRPSTWAAARPWPPPPPRGTRRPTATAAPPTTRCRRRTTSGTSSSSSRGASRLETAMATAVEGVGQAPQGVLLLRECTRRTWISLKVKPATDAAFYGRVKAYVYLHEPLYFVLCDFVRHLLTQSGSILIFIGRCSMNENHVSYV